MLTCLSLLLRKLHVVKDPEHNAEQILPPVFLVGVTVRLHHLKHYCQTPVNKTKIYCREGEKKNTTVLYM